MEAATNNTFFFVRLRKRKRTPFERKCLRRQESLSPKKNKEVNLSLSAQKEPFRERLWTAETPRVKKTRDKKRDENEVKNSPEGKKGKKRPKRRAKKKKRETTTLSNSSATRVPTDVDTTSTARRRKSDARGKKRRTFR